MPFTIHRWADREVDGHLVGEAEVLRSVYFGDLRLSLGEVVFLHSKSVAPIKAKWLPRLNIDTEAYLRVRRWLCEPESWAEISEWRKRQSTTVAELRQLCKSLAGDELDIAQELVDCCAMALQAFKSTDDVKSPWIILRHLENLATLKVTRRVVAFDRRIRIERRTYCYQVQSGIAGIVWGARLARAVRNSFDRPLVAILGAAGFGKTHLAAELTKPSGTRPGGVVLRGRNLQRRGLVDSLCWELDHRFKSFSEMIEALNAVGQRAGFRIPVVIDGLNESEDPRDWQERLSVLDVVLRKSPFVLLVVTCRPNVAGQCLPEGVDTEFLQGFENRTSEAISAYFQEYKIKWGTIELPFALLNQPLFLRMFCEVVNPSKQHVVDLADAPKTATGVFAKYLDGVADRVAASSRRDAREIRQAITRVGKELWKARARSLEFARLRDLVGDPDGAWDVSVARHLEEEGIIERSTDFRSQETVSSIVFDAVAGFVVAEGIVSAIRDKEALAAWIVKARVEAKLFGKAPKAHPLAEDIRSGLAGLLPRTRGVHLWEVLTGDRQVEALLLAAGQEPRYIGAATVRKIEDLFQDGDARSRARILSRLFEVRFVNAHPFNASFLDRVLAPMPLAERDLTWTEWVRRRQEELLDELEWIETQLTGVDARKDVIELVILWCKWLGTSSVRQVRDSAIRVLTQCGSLFPRALYSAAADSTCCNDPYVVEALLASCYGVCLQNQLLRNPSSEELICCLGLLMEGLNKARSRCELRGYRAQSYIEGIVSFANAFVPGSENVASLEAVRAGWPSSVDAESIADGDHRERMLQHALQMDFDNYSLGGLVEGRLPYDDKHEEYLRVRHLARGIIWRCGWRYDRFNGIDSEIGGERYRSRMASPQTERYGKKYCWIAYQELAAMIRAERRATAAFDESERDHEAGVDVSFPVEPPPCPVPFIRWAKAGRKKSDNTWLRSGEVRVDDEWIKPESLDGVVGPWMLVEGFLDDKVENRGAFGFFRTMIVSTADVEKLRSLFMSQEYPGNHFIPSVPESYYAYAGELPWSDILPVVADDGAERYRIHVGRWSNDPVEGEVLAHSWNYESYHSPLDQPGHAYVPSVAMSRALQLRRVPPAFDHTNRDGRTESRSFSAPEGFAYGQLLYVREDTVRGYMAGADQAIVMMAWGERNAALGSEKLEPRAQRAYREYLHIWRRFLVL